ncbi:MAG: SMI1/KNR4 family protein [Lachnospiraceae bacterium]|nr:SMI1/KNR4 family protein [Lachnospiraceae bacterium]
MDLIQKIKRIEQYVLENFEELDLDDPIEEGYWKEYQEIPGASQKEIEAFEKKFSINLPKDFKALYSYKNGSKYFIILPSTIHDVEMSFSLMSLEQMEKTKQHFQNRDALLTEFPDFFTEEEIEKMRDSRIKPYLFHKQWIPFAEYCDSCFLMLDFDPDQEGKEGQILCYIHDPDEVIYAAVGLSEFVDEILLTID